MYSRWKLVLALALMPLLSSCVAAVLPLAAAGVIGNKIRTDALKSVSEYEAEARGETSGNVTDNTAQGGPDMGAPGNAAESKAALLQYLESFRQKHSSETYGGFVDFSLSQAKKYGEGESISSVILESGFSVTSPTFMPCGGLPPAVMIDLDDHIGSQAVSPLNDTQLITELAASLSVLRQSEITILWLSDQSTEEAADIIASLRSANLLGDGDDFLSLDRGGKDRKQLRRQEASSRFCIIAMAGDRKSDFDELYDYLKKPGSFTALNSMWNAGWFEKPIPDVTNSADGRENGVSAAIGDK